MGRMCKCSMGRILSTEQTHSPQSTLQGWGTFENNMSDGIEQWWANCMQTVWLHNVAHDCGKTSGDVLQGWFHWKTSLPASSKGEWARIPPAEDVPPSIVLKLTIMERPTEESCNETSLARCLCWAPHDGERGEGEQGSCEPCNGYMLQKCIRFLLKT